MRADAVRNHRRILDAAAQLLAERGLEVTLDDIAAAADIGVGTVYRRYPNKRALVIELFVAQLDEIVDTAEAAVLDPNPWYGLTRFVELTCEMVAGNRGFATVMTELQDGAILFEEHRERLLPAVEALLRRGKAAGSVRPEVELADVLAVIGMVHAIAAWTGPVDPDNWRRYLIFLLNGIRTATEPELPLTTPALTEEQMNEARVALVRRRK
ncbi:TetR/AcrR family transcriptional regulator [Nocardia vinacea]|uniref:TetR/AcrR family transcriptional regulator n=1 Tax=Nocardia vinacea TaxID=96468 RepID=A0ABZ1YRJ4_9NOCA|nr:TetR/AcrR family transcriptional regulator [Nocardia vinacea]